jgi:hypothetical protein
MRARLSSPWAGELHDLSRVISLAARDPDAAVEEIVATAGRRAPSIEDWPDLLAIALGADAVGKIGDWALGMGLSAEGVSRGFQRCYGASPSRFRADARARRALATVISGVAISDRGPGSWILRSSPHDPGDHETDRPAAGCLAARLRLLAKQNIDGSRSN